MLWECVGTLSGGLERQTKHKRPLKALRLKLTSQSSILALHLILVAFRHGGLRAGFNIVDAEVNAPMQRQQPSGVYIAKPDLMTRAHAKLACPFY